MIRFADLKSVNNQYSSELNAAIKRVLDSGWFIKGGEVESFESAFADYCNVRECVGVANGLDALTLIFRAYLELGLMQVGDEVIVPSNTFIASFLAITENRLKPVLVEPDLTTYNIDITKIKKKITKRTKAFRP